MFDVTALRAERLLVTLVTGNVALVAVYVLDIVLDQPNWTVHVLFNLDGEGTIPAWYSSAQLLIAGWLFAVAPSADPPLSIPRAFLALVAIGFSFLSMDEIVGVHESITRSFRDVEALPRFSGNHGIWIPFYLGVGGLFAVATAGYWLRLWRIERRGMVMFGTGIALLLGGAVGVEAASYEEWRGLVHRRPYLWTVGVEEFLEMCGASCLLAAALKINQALSALGSRSEQG